MPPHIGGTSPSFPTEIRVAESFPSLPSVPITITCALITAFVFWTHRANIGRLRRGEENRFRRGAKVAT